jgi:uncharacterized oxidoreductase
MIVDEERLRALTSAIFVGAGSSEAEAGQVARQLVGANLAGHDSHGVGRIPLYVVQAGDGRVKPNQHVRTIKDTGVILVLDGEGGYGHVIAGEAMALGIERAREHGLCLLALRNSFHVGRVGAWAEMCLDAGFASVHFVNSNAHAPLVAPFGGAAARLSTNPFCAAVPSASGEPVILDMATASLAEGKIHVAFNKGREVPDGTLIDAEGRPTNDPGALYREPRGALLSMGTYKGSGLGLMCELLAGALGGGGIMGPENIGYDRIVNHMLSIIIDPAALGDGDAFLDDVAAAVGWVKSSPPAPGGEGVMVAGDPERRARADRMANGITIDDVTWKEILAAADSVGVGGNRVAAILDAAGAPATGG